MLSQKKSVLGGTKVMFRRLARSIWSPGGGESHSKNKRVLANNTCRGIPYPCFPSLNVSTQESTIMPTKLFLLRNGILRAVAGLSAALMFFALSNRTQAQCDHGIGGSLGINTTNCLGNPQDASKLQFVHPGDFIGIR